MNIINITLSFKTVYITHYILKCNTQNGISYSNDDQYNWTRNARSLKFSRKFQIKLTHKSLGKEHVEIVSFGFRLTG
jgi:hypothetical protein